MRGEVRESVEEDKCFRFTVQLVLAFYLDGMDKISFVNTL